MIVNIHWGTEYVQRSRRQQRALAQRLTRSPAIDAIVGQHAHVVQPIRRVNGKPVVFGEGNLISNQTSACCTAASQDGLIALIDFVVSPGQRARARRIRYVPTWVRHPDYTVHARRAGLGVVEPNGERGRPPAIRPLKPRGLRGLTAVRVRAMQIRAAVLEEFAKPLVVQDVELQGPGRARCWCAWRPAACATPTSTRPVAPTRPATRRRCSGTRARAWSRRSARA